MRVPPSECACITAVPAVQAALEKLVSHSVYWRQQALAAGFVLQAVLVSASGREVAELFQQAELLPFEHVPDICSTSESTFSLRCCSDPA